MGGTPTRHFRAPEKKPYELRQITHINHTLNLFKQKYGLLNVNDMFLLNKLKFSHKLYHNNLPVYFEGYWEQLIKTELEHNLRSRILPVPRIHHVYAESLFVYQ